MGYNQESHRVTVCAAISNHNSAKDIRDQKLWAAAQEEIRFAIQQLDLEKRYRSINLNIVEGT